MLAFTEHSNRTNANIRRHTDQEYKTFLLKIKPVLELYHFWEQRGIVSKEMTQSWILLVLVYTDISTFKEASLRCGKHSSLPRLYSISHSLLLMTGNKIAAMKANRIKSEEQLAFCIEVHILLTLLNFVGIWDVINSIPGLYEMFVQLCLYLRHYFKRMISTINPIDIKLFLQNSLALNAWIRPRIMYGTAAKPRITGCSTERDKFEVINLEMAKMVADLMRIMDSLRALASQQELEQYASKLRTLLLAYMLCGKLLP